MMSRRWRHRYSILLVATLLLVSSGRILKFAAESLVCDEQIQPGDAIAMFSGDRSFDFAAQAVSDGRAQRILVFEGRFQWVVHVGALPSSHEIAQQQLVDRNLNTCQIELLAGPTMNAWDRAARVAAWLDQHPEGSVVLLCDRFESQKVRFVLDQVLPVSASERVRTVGLADRRFDETNWWKSRTGIKSFVGAMLGLVHTHLVGLPPPVKSGSWDPVEYERKLARQMDMAS